MLLVEYVVLTHKSLKERRTGSLFPTPVSGGRRQGCHLTTRGVAQSVPVGEGLFQGAA